MKLFKFLGRNFISFGGVSQGSLKDFRLAMYVARWGEEQAGGQYGNR